jgi:CDP-diacylglycerol--glycerol-3-phosphate 3-phosphatidyltransferase
MLDPIADKLLISSILMMLVSFRKVEVVPCLMILSREIVISGLREFLAQVHVSVPVSKLAKIKTAMQMVALFVLLLGSKGSGFKYLDMLGKILLWISAILTLITGYSYFEASKKYF